MPGEDPADFDRQLSALEADIQPANSLEFELVRQIADAQWRMRPPHAFGDRLPRRCR